MADKTTVATELAKTETVTLTLTSENGFAGDVTLAARLVDATDNALPNINVTGPTTVALAANGTGTAAYQIQIPMNATGSNLEGSLKVELMSSAGNQLVTSTVTINAIYTVDYGAGTGAVVANHMNSGVTGLSVKRGAIIRFHNGDTTGHIIHGDNTVFPHENTTTGGKPGRNYDIQTIGIAPGSVGTLGCHDHTTDTYSQYRVE